MIERIEISGCASYGDDVEVLEGLAPINFIYGPNGAGKTTVSRLISDASSHPRCAVHWRRGTELETMVYNRDFVQANFSQSANLRGIFTLGQKDIETQDKIIRANDHLDHLIRKIESLTEALQGTDGNGGQRGELAKIEGDFRDECWKVKVEHDDKLQGALTGYRGDKQKFKDKILAERAKADLQYPDRGELETKAASVFGSETTVEEIPSLNAVAFLAWESASVLKKRVIGKTDVDIAALIQKLNNSDWVKQGLAYLDESDGSCPFCQQKAPDDLATSLAEYFDETFARDTAAIDAVKSGYESEGERVKQALQTAIASQSALGPSTQFLNVDKLRQKKAIFDSCFQLNQQHINMKVKEPSQIVTLDPLGDILDEAIQLISDANRLVLSHNAMVANLAAEKVQLTSQIWAFLSKGELATVFAAYNSKKTAVQRTIETIIDEIARCSAEKKAKEAEIRDLHKGATSIQPTVDYINSILTGFGFGGFHLKLAAENLYRICRPDGSDAKETLSEGERGFVTFLYFFHLLKGSVNDSGVIPDRVVVFDDPVSSLDSDVLFIVSTLIRQVIDDARNGTSPIKQVFVLTHNVFFHKEVTYGNGRKNEPTKDITYWTIRKPQGISKVSKHASNPVTTAYELLWEDVRDPIRAGQAVQNSLRRILEHYFKILGGRNFADIVAMFEGEDKLICKALFSWVHDGSHTVSDELYLALDEGAIHKYLGVFRKIFNKTGHTSHYNMMMGEPFIIESNEEASSATPMPAQ